MTQQKILTTPWRWFMRGFLVGVLLSGALNALSFFVRTKGWGSLLGATSAGTEALGFPWEMWRQSASFNGYIVDPAAMALNIGTGIVVGGLIGFAALTQLRWLNRMVADIETKMQAKANRPFQFSLRALLMATLIVALFASLGRSLTARPEMLGAIYLFGPSSLVIMAMLPRGISWQQRVAILTPAAIAMIVLAAVVGTALGIEIDKVLMGIFVSWVPQSALAAIGITMGILLVYYRRYCKAMQADAIK